jgi:hypothetical protein
LQPGVARIEAQSTAGAGADRGEHGFGTHLTISGGKPVQNNYRLDGINVNDYANSGPGSVLGPALGVDAVQEFSVITGNYSAEYGRTSGGVVNAITCSGTNDFHGSVFEFIRNSAMDARNFFNTVSAGPQNPFKRNQFGGSIGGPIIKDGTFFFANYEGVRQSKGTSTQASVPTALARTRFASGRRRGSGLLVPMAGIRTRHTMTRFSPEAFTASSLERLWNTSDPIRRDFLMLRETGLSIFRTS